MHMSKSHLWLEPCKHFTVFCDNMATFYEALPTKLVSGPLPDGRCPILQESLVQMCFPLDTSPTKQNRIGLMAAFSMRAFSIALRERAKPISVSTDGIRMPMKMSQKM